VSTPTTSFYVGREASGRLHPALGPFAAERDAQACVPAVCARERALGLPDQRPPEVISLTGGPDQAAPEGSLNPYFPRGLLDPHRLPADVVHCWTWTAAGTTMVRWVVYAEVTPALVLGRGQFPLANPELSMDLVRAEVAAQDPLLARTVSTWAPAPAARGVGTDGTLRVVPLRANRLDVGTLIAEGPADATRAYPVVFLQHVKDADDLYTYVHYRVRLDGDLHQCPQHSFVSVVDLSLRDVAPAAPAEPERPRSAATRSTSSQPSSDDGPALPADQLALFGP
jgi:hypothetical protein